MAVRPQDLATPEEGLELETRTPGPEKAQKAEPKEESPDPGQAEAAVDLLKDRMREAGPMLPPERESCRDCWRSGHRAAFALIRRATAQGTPAEQLEAILAALDAARALQPEPLHDPDCWKRGRDAAIAAIEG